MTKTSLSNIKNISECTILIVDDTQSNIDILVDTLGDLYDLSVALDGKSALEIVHNEKPDLILLDIMMPEMDGYDTIKNLKKDPQTASIPVIFLTAMQEIENKTKGFNLGAVDYITKPFEIAEIKSRVETHLGLSLAKQHLANQNIILEHMVEERTRELALTQDATINCMAVLAECRDPETGGHIMRTQNYVKALSEQLQKNNLHTDILNDDNIELIYKSAPLHDIGKVGIPDSVLLKTGKLTDSEWVIMKKHPALGARAILAAEARLGGTSFLRFAGEIALGHHEKWDGTGYPAQLKGTKIPVSARLMALADVYDALISKRVYKAPFSHPKAVSIILEGRATHFDPDMVDAFYEIQEEFRQIAIEYADHKEEREMLQERLM